MKKRFTVFTILFPILILGTALITVFFSTEGDTKILFNNLKLELSEENENDAETSNSALYYKMQALEEAYAEMSSRLSEDRLEELQAEATKQAKLELFPIGSIFTSINDANPSSYIGGKWEAYGEGRTLIGSGNNGTKSYSVGEIGGSETHTHTAGSTVLTTEQLPNHTHMIPTLTGTTASAGVHNHYFSYNGGGYAGWPYSGTGGSAINFFLGNSSGTNKTGIANAGAHTHSVTTQAGATDSTGENEGHTHTITEVSSHSPYVVVYFWRRIE